MREILFRGKRADNGEWVYGYVWKNPREQYFITEYNTLTMYAVIPETVGQYTGRRDKNGVKLFDGDIFTLGDMNIKYITTWHDNGFMGKQLGTKGSMVGLTHWEDRIEIIGNVHDEEEDDEL